MSGYHLDRPRRACRLCGATVNQRVVGRERTLDLGQELVRCGLCGGASLDPDLSAADEARFYEHDYRRLFTAEAAFRHQEAFVASLRLRAIAQWRWARLGGFVPLGGAVLEVGSGYGAFLSEIHRDRPDVPLAAIEPDAHHRAVALGGTKVTFVASPEEAGGPFALIALFHSLEHLRDPAGSLVSLRRLLAPGGILAIEVPDIAAPWSGWQDVHAAHLGYFTGPALDRLCQRVGLRPLEGQTALPGTLWRVLRRCDPQPPLPAPPQEIAALDRHIDRYRHRWRDRLKRRLKTLAVAVLGPQRIGAWQRRRLGPLTDRMLAQAAGSRQRLFGLPVDALTMTEAIDRAETAMRTRQRLRQADINVAKLVAMSGDRLLRADVAGSDMVCVDGMGVLWAARLLGVAIPERITGIDLMDHLLARAGRGGFRPYILGAEATVLDEAVASLRRRYPDLVFAGWHHGYFSPAEEPAVVAAIAASRADCLFVAMPSPAKEAFLARHHAALGVAYVMGVGGSIDVIAGKRWRAPRWMQRAGLEWLARLIQDPRHLGPRYLKSNSLFLGLVIKEWIRLRRGGAEDT